MNFLENNKKSYIYLFLIYFCTNLFLLINYQGIYWDDWAVYGQEFETIYNMFFQASGYSTNLISEIHYHLINTFGIFSYRLLTLLLLFLNGAFLYEILKSIKLFSHQDRFFITLFFLIIPVFGAKVAIIDFPYVLFGFIFFFSFYLLSIHVKTGNWILRIVSLSLFFVSFLVNSLLVFYALPLFYIFYVNYANNINFKKNIFHFLKTKIDFLCVPILFFGTKIIYFSPSGLYKGYNSMGMNGFLEAPMNSVISLYTSFIHPINVSFSLLGMSSVIILLFVLYAICSQHLPRENEYFTNNKHVILLLLVGLAMFFAAVLPYCIVGKVPNLYGWESRHQLLVPLGFAFMLYYMILYFSSKFKLNQNLHISILNIFIVAFMAKTMYDGYKYNLDWFYSVSIQENVKDIKEVENNTTFITIVSGTKYVANERVISFYEYNGMFKKVFGNDKRLVVNDISDIENVKKYMIYKQYNFSTWIYNDPVYLSIKENNIGTKDKIRMFYYYIFNYTKFLESTKKLTNISVLRS